MAFKILLADTETTGGSSKDEIIELSHVPLPDLSTFVITNLVTEDCGGGHIYTERFRPSVSIHPEAFKVHKITFSDLISCRKSEHAKLKEVPEYLLGHNIAFDHRFLGKPETKLICTLDLSRKFAKVFENYKPENHKLDYLSTYLRIENEEIPFVIQEVHSAENDIRKNMFVLQKLLLMIPGVTTWDELYTFQQSLKKK